MEGVLPLAPLPYPLALVLLAYAFEMSYECPIFPSSIFISVNLLSDNRAPQTPLYELYFGHHRDGGKDIMAANREERLEHWAAIIDEAEASGQKINKWCHERNITRSQYYYWHKVLNDLGKLPQPNGLIPNDKHFASPAVLPVAEISLTDSYPAGDILPGFFPQMMILRNSCQIYVGSTVNQDTLRQVMEVIKEC